MAGRVAAMLATASRDERRAIRAPLVSDTEQPALSGLCATPVGSTGRCSFRCLR
jgi:hypothetical protein